MTKRTKEDAKPHANGKTGAKREAVYLLSLSLENVRCFGPKQTLDLSDGEGKPARWTIILGLNGTGKTTLLQYLGGLFLDPLSGPLDTRDPPLFFPGVLRHQLRKTAERGLANLTFGVSGCLIEDVRSRISRKVILREGGSCTLQTLAHDSDFWMAAYGEQRLASTSSLSTTGSSHSCGSLYSDEALLRNPEEWLLRLDYSASKQANVLGQQTLRLDHAREMLLKILPDIENIRFDAAAGPNPEPRVEFKTPYGWVPLRQLGYGYQTLITWVADLANRMAERYPDSPNPLAEPAVVLVDEIDLHLHPQWQRKLIGYLTERFPNTQFIATAHSPLVVQAAADANLAVLRREGDHVVIDNDVDDIRGWRIDQILTSDLFGLETARPPHVEKALLERKKILTKAKLTAADKKRVKELETEIGDLPQGETPDERKERQRLTELLERLEKGKRPPA